jgi:hypothetical protein
VPQAPQFFGSIDRSLQVEPHCVVPPPQLSAQAPFEQTSPVLQAVAHAPQWEGSTVTSTHAPPQLCWPAGHALGSAVSTTEASVCGGVAEVSSPLHPKKGMTAELAIPIVSCNDRLIFRTSASVEPQSIRYGDLRIHTKAFSYSSRTDSQIVAR